MNPKLPDEQKDTFDPRKKQESIEFIIKSAEDLNAYHERRISDFISSLDETGSTQDPFSEMLRDKILFDDNFKEVFGEWYGLYFNPHPFPPLDSYQSKIDEYADHLANFFPEIHRLYWKDFFSQALFQLSQEDFHTVRFVLNSGNYLTDIRKLHQGIHRILYESSFSPLLNVIEKKTADHFTYIVSCRNIELCRIWIDHSSEESGITATWRTQTILDDLERNYTINLWSDIFVEFNEIQKQTRRFFQVEQSNVNEREATASKQQDIASKLLAPPQVSALGKRISQLYDEDELRDLARKLSIDYENLSGDNKLRKAHELVEYFNRREKALELLSVLQEERPREDWLKDLDVNLP